MQPFGVRCNGKSQVTGIESYINKNYVGIIFYWCNGKSQVTGIESSLCRLVYSREILSGAMENPK